MSKGSRSRPIEIPRDQYRDNFDRIFGRKPADTPAKPNDKTNIAK
jgi:hypothetical protein